jgi:F0F1-type ATP synthase assembly protein I
MKLLFSGLTLVVNGTFIICVLQVLVNVIATNSLAGVPVVFVVVLLLIAVLSGVEIILRSFSKMAAGDQS